MSSTQTFLRQTKPGLHFIIHVSSMKNMQVAQILVLFSVKLVHCLPENEHLNIFCCYNHCKKADCNTFHRNCRKAKQDFTLSLDLILDKLTTVMSRFFFKKLMAEVSARAQQKATFYIEIDFFSPFRMPVDRSAFKQMASSTSLLLF